MAKHSFSKCAVDRNQQLDFLRAMAIVMVVIYHVIGMSPISMPELVKVSTIGQYGVDLFFVLSGWLIGGLYWREQMDFGDVELLRFWLRRWLRTIPPYLVVLLLSWLAVWISRRESFDYGFLIFIQNYYPKIPFFLVSWSLCIEEHFYIFLPLILVILTRRKISVAAIFATLLLVAPVSRAYLSLNGVSPEFGFDQTATHLRMEGLLLGFWLSFLSVNKFEAWSIVVRLSSWVIAGSVLVLIVTQFTNAGWMYRVGYSAMALGLAGLLVFMIGRKAGIVARWPCVKAIALASYSVYLTHPLMIHLSNILMAKIPGISLFFYFPLVIMMIIIGGAVFYLSVERNAIILRDRWVPRRVLATKVNS